MDVDRAGDATPFFVPSPGELEKALTGMTSGDAVLLAEQYVRVNNPHAAAEVCAAARRLGLAEPSLTLAEARARFARGERSLATALVNGVLANAPRHPTALNLKAHMLAAAGDRAESREHLLRLIEVFPDFPGAHALLAGLSFPGLPYRDVLAKIHQSLKPETYLELGVESGRTLALAVTAKLAVGVDPATRLERPLAKNARLYDLESDAFFERESKESVFGERDVDLTFIDGMHLFEYALRDFMNVEKWASPHGTVVFHDCLPISVAAANRERASDFWVGDTWKVLDTLLEFRPDLRVRVVPTAPSGLVVVRGLDKTSRVLEEHMPEILARYTSAEYDHTPAYWAEHYPIVRNDDAGLADALRS